MAGGRPRTIYVDPQELIDLGEEMIEWVTENKPLHLSQFYTIYKRLTYNEWKTLIVRQEFFPYYEQALKIVALKYIDGTINQSIAQRFLRVYFKDVKEEEDQTMRDKIDYEVKSKVQMAEAVNEECTKALNSTFGQLKAMREKLGIDDSNAKSE